MAEAVLRKFDSLTVRVTISRGFRVRVWLAVLLVRAAAIVLGGRIVIEIDA